MRVQEVSMCEKKPVECKAISREEEKRSGAARADEGEDLRVGGEKQAVGGRKYHLEGAVEPTEGESVIQVDSHEHNRAYEQDFARQLS